jgi:hypothetical protein
MRSREQGGGNIRAHLCRQRLDVCLARGDEQRQEALRRRRPSWDSTSSQREKETEMTSATSIRPYALSSDEGIADLWWPYGPVVGRYTISPND